MAYRLAFAETHTYVTLEPYIVRAWELKRVEAGQQRLRVCVVVPFAEYSWIGGASVLVRHYVLVFDVVFDRFRDTTPGVSSVDACRK